MDTNFSSKVKYFIPFAKKPLNDKWADTINLSICNFWRLELLGSVIIAIVKDINLVVARK